jgi:hypothetical protein
MIRISKRAYEEIFRYHQFCRSDGAGWLNASGTLTGTPTVTVEEAGSGTDRTSEMISNVAVYDSTQVVYLLKAGATNTIYIITIRVVSSNGQKFEDRIELKVL